MCRHDERLARYLNVNPREAICTGTVNLPHTLAPAGTEDFRPDVKHFTIDPLRALAIASFSFNLRFIQNKRANLATLALEIVVLPKR